ncbi:WD repeat-containing protein [Saccharata proteae CBS 121410]|uniref:DNA damage-binding protein CMR1 n=1 Tax=Saccharata proteae CBS 121410 TaxID=1314787 RepID=A0A9P4HV68_9PEZI|nr:WD repeat-containing protein [Saccharata proteae CBS 121410]
MGRKSAAEVNEYELKRQEQIAKNQALLRSLALDAQSAGLAPIKAKSSATPSKDKKRKTPAKKVAEEVAPRRTSSRLRGIVADSEVAKRKAEDEYEAIQQAERAKRQRVSDDLNLSDIVVAGKHWNSSGNFLTGVGPAKPYERTFSAQDVKKTTDKELRALREKMSGLQLWEGFEPSRIKITQERIYSLGFHPTQDKALIFAGDKLGNLGLFDGSQTVPEVKQEDDEDEEDEAEPAVTTFKLHTRTISAFQFSPTEENSLYSASYDSSIRKLDLNKGTAVEVYAPTDKSEDAPISGVDVATPNMIYFTTLEGAFGIHDVRAPSDNTGGTQILQLSEKKIGGFTMNPIYPHLVATASLDRMMKIWDLRKISGKDEWRLPALVGEHESRLSVSHAAWNAAGQVATASYDDTVKIYDFPDCGSWKAGTSLTDEQMEPAAIIPHNNQTGRWVTILRAQWQVQPQDGIQRFCIGNMNRFVDIYTSKGEQLAQLGGDGITAVPAVAQFHPTMDWIAAGTASGKLCFWQ